MISVADSGSSIAFDYLQKTFDGFDDVGLVCIYNNYKAPTTAKEIISNVLKQLLENQPLSKNVEKLYHAHEKRETYPDLPELLDLLRLESSRLSSIFVVVDALDECPADDNVGFSILSDLHQISSARMLITGRPHVADLISRFDSQILHIRADDKDVRLVLEAELIKPSFHKCLHDDEGLRAEVVSTVMTKADGM